MQKECLEEINRLLSVPDINTATQLYTDLKCQKLMKIAVMDLMYTYLSKRNDMTRLAISSHDLDIFADNEVAALSAVVSSNTDTKLSKENLSIMIHDYQKCHEIQSPYHLAHWSDAHKNVSIDDPVAINVIGLECIYNGWQNQTSGLKELTRISEGYRLSIDTTRKFEEIFAQEKELLHSTGAAYCMTAMEMFSTRDDVLQGIVAGVHKYSVNEFKKKITEGDILITYRKAKYIGLAGVVLNKMNESITGSSFMSCKLVGPHAESVIGYGTKIADTTSSCQSVPIDYYIETCSGILCLTHKNITNVRRQRILDYAKKILEIGVPYSFMTIVKMIFMSKKKEQLRKLTKSEATHYFTPMICTTFAIAAYKAAGLSMAGIENDEKSWPIDVAKSPDLVPVAAYFDRDQFK